VCTLLQNVLPHASSLDTIVLPNTMNLSSWKLEWLSRVPRLLRLDMNSTSFRVLMSRGLQVSSLSQIHTVRVLLTNDVPMQHKESLVSLRDVTVSFGAEDRSPSAGSLAELFTCHN